MGPAWWQGAFISQGRGASTLFGEGSRLGCGHGAHCASPQAPGTGKCGGDWKTSIKTSHPEHQGPINSFIMSCSEGFTHFQMPQTSPPPSSGIQPGPPRREGLPAQCCAHQGWSGLRHHHGGRGGVGGGNCWLAGGVPAPNRVSESASSHHCWHQLLMVGLPRKQILMAPKPSCPQQRQGCH